MKSSLPLSSFHISTVLLFCCSLPSSCSGSTASATSATLLLLMIVHMHIIAWCVLIFWIGVVLHVVCLYFSKREGIRYWPEGTQYERKGIRHSVVLIPILTSYKIPSIYILLARRHIYREMCSHSSGCIWGLLSNASNDKSTEDARFSTYYISLASKLTTIILH